MKTPPQNPIVVPELDERIYARYMRALEAVKSRLSVKLRVTEEAGAMEQGDIFLFNHFTHIETTIPPSVIYASTGKLVRSVAFGGLFQINTHFTKHMLQAGAVPTNLPGLLPFLAKEILRGRKVVIFPEGGIIRDKQVMDEKGDYGIYSDRLGISRKHHRGAAALGVTLDIIKHHLRVLFATSNEQAINLWCQELGLSLQELKTAAEKRTLVVPGTITFYPIRAGENGLIRNLEKFVGNLPATAFADLVVESNILIHDTDMYVHFGTPIRAMPDLGWTDKVTVNHALANTSSTQSVFDLLENNNLALTYYKHLVDKNTNRLRDDYTSALYKGTAVNFNHIMATLIAQLVEQAKTVVNKPYFRKILYLAVKNLQKEKELNLHITLKQPSTYRGLLEGEGEGFNLFIRACLAAGIMWEEGDDYIFSPEALARNHAKNSLRIENPLRVHLNEIAPIKRVAEVVNAAIREAWKPDEKIIAAHLFEDELTEFEGLREYWNKKAPATVLNSPPPHSGRPYFMLQEKRAKVGVLLVHGFSALPSDLRPFAEHLFSQGYTVLGMRLPGHGTSWKDMENRSREEWYTAIRTHLHILSAHVDKIIIIGASTGAAAALKVASEHPEKLVAVAAAAAPFYVQDRNINLLPTIMLVRKVLGWVPGVHQVLGSYPFGNPEDLNKYNRVTITALNQLRLLTHDLSATLPRVTVPTLLLQGTADATVQPRSAEALAELLSASTVTLISLPGAPHNLIQGNVGPTWKELKKFLRSAGGVL